MSTEFSKKLSMLRKEKGISQRSVAAQLNISQALLSHYEKGIREPGLDFVMRVCEFYDVSADYLLGRVESRDNEEIWKETPYIMEDIKEKTDYFRRMLVDCVNSMMTMALSSKNEQIVEETACYLLCGIYKLMQRFERTKEDAELMITAANIEMMLSETRLMKCVETDAISNSKGKSKALDKAMEIAQMRIRRNI